MGGCGDEMGVAMLEKHGKPSLKKPGD